MSGPGSAMGWQVAGETVLYFAFSVMAAALAACAWLRTRSSGWARAARSQAVAMTRGASGIALFAVAAQLVWQTAEMRSSPGAGPFWRSLLSMTFETHVGRSACVAAASSIVVSAAAMSRGFADGRVLAIAIAAGAVAVFAAARSVVSHAGAMGDLSLAVGVLWLHLLLIGGWIGSVVLSAFAAFSAAPRSRGDRVDALAWLAALSRTAGSLLFGIALTGGFNLWHAGASASAGWWRTPYAIALGAKLLWVATAAGLGALNRFARLPALLHDGVAPEGRAGMGDPTAGAEGERRWRAVVGVLRVESFVLLLALAASTVLGNTEPPDR